MLNAAVAADGFLIGPRVEKTDILRSSPQFRQKDRIRVRLPVVIVLAVAGQPSEENPLVLAVPVIDGEQNVPLVDPPDVGQRRHERAVDHIPALAIVLLLLVDDREKRRAALADGKRSELGEDVRLVDSGLIAYVLDLGDDLLGNVLVVVVESERVLDRETASDIQRVELRADFLQLAINVQTLAQLIPVVRGILDSGIDEKVQHLEPEFLVPLDFRTIILDDIVITDTQSRRIEIELRLLLRGDPDTDFAPGIDRRVEQLELLLIIDDRNRILKAAVDQRGDVFDILRTLESVAYDVNALIDHAAVVQRIDDMDIVGRRRFEIDVVLERLLQHEREVRALGAIAIVIAAFIVNLGHRHIEQAFGALNLRSNLRQIGYLQRRSVLLDYVHQRNLVKIQFVVRHRKLILRKLESLLDQIDILILHQSIRFARTDPDQLHSPIKSQSDSITSIK